MTARKRVSGGEAGRRDGFDGMDPLGDTDAYLAGHAEGVQQRAEASERVTQTCRRWARMANSVAGLKATGAGAKG